MFVFLHTCMIVWLTFVMSDGKAGADLNNVEIRSAFPAITTKFNQMGMFCHVCLEKRKMFENNFRE